MTKQQKRDIFQSFLLYLSNYDKKKDLDISVSDRKDLEITIEGPSRQLTLVDDVDAVNLLINGKQRDVWEYNWMRAFNQNIALFMAREIIKLLWAGEI